MSAEPPELTRAELRRVADEFKSARDAAERDTLRAIEDRNAALEALRNAEAALAQADNDLADAVAWIRVVGEECVLAGMPGGDRTVILANIRRVLQALPRAGTTPEPNPYCDYPGRGM
jgi:regulator of protease activity HflC (stomatin/prohibitin superfamily)